MEPAHSSLSPKLSRGMCIFLDLFQNLTSIVVGDVPIDSEVSVVTSSISRICRLSLLKMLIARGVPLKPEAKCEIRRWALMALAAAASRLPSVVAV